MGTDGNFKADIPDSVFADAVASVERTLGKEAGGVEIEVEGPGGEPAAPADPGEVERLRALLEESANRAAQTQERLKETHERSLRIAADFENWKKRAAKERDDAQKFGNERLLKDILPVVDNLERALLAAPADDTQAALVEGVKLVLRQFTDVLGRYGVKGFSAVGTPFDPNRHEALMQQETADVAPGTVVSEMAKGYLLHDRLVRPAAVVVAKAPQPAEPPVNG